LPSGTIILVIVALWAAVLVPALLRSHDETTESKSVDRFTRAMRTLRRNDPLPGDDRTVLMPRRPAAAVEPQLFSKSEGGVARRSAPSRIGSPSLMARRRRALRSMAIAMLATLLLGIVVGGLTWMLQGMADGLVVVYVLHLRAEAKRAHVLARRRVSRLSLYDDAVFARDVTSSAAADDRLARRVAFDDGIASVADDGAAGAVDAGSREWQPIPVPPPTYVNAPKAPPRGKQVEVPPSWADGLRDDGVHVDLTALDRVEPEIDRLLQRRRAVND
jgi:hypothetical protein